MRNVNCKMIHVLGAWCLVKIANLVLRASPRSRMRGSEFDGFAGEDCELFWNTKVL